MHKNNSSVMKHWIAGLSATFVMALSGLVPDLSYSQDSNKVGFYCGRSTDGKPATIFKRTNGEKFPFIIWEVKKLANPDYIPEKYCQIVSKRLEDARKEQALNYITAGVMNGESVICAAKVQEGRCTSLLFSIGKDKNPIGVLMTTLSIRYGFSGIPTLYEAGSIPYFDVSQIIGYASPRFEIDKQVTITCSTSNRIPITVVRTSKSDIPIIIWKSNTFTGSGWTPEKRCQEVSQRFENLRYKNSINYITSGVINEQSVICAVKAKNEPCTSEGLLFTLEKDADPQKILKQMFLSNSDIPVDDNGVVKRDGRDSVCMSRSASGNCSGLLISAIEL